MTLNDQLEAAQRHRDAEEKNFDMQIGFIAEQKKNSLEMHDKAIATIKAQIEAHKAFIGEAA
jgi:hypothetical protein